MGIGRLPAPEGRRPHGQPQREVRGARRRLPRPRAGRRREARYMHMCISLSLYIHIYIYTYIIT